MDGRAHGVIDRRLPLVAGSGDADALFHLEGPEVVQRTRLAALAVPDHRIRAPLHVDLEEVLGPREPQADVEHPTQQREQDEAADRDPPRRDCQPEQPTGETDRDDDEDPSRRAARAIDVAQEALHRHGYRCRRLKA